MTRPSLQMPRGRFGGLGRRSALRFVVLVGIVSLFADMTYEGSRSITGPYLALLGASGAVVGVVAGLGELLGYGLRIVSGRFSDRTGAYWPITVIGYLIQMTAVPALALAGTWQLAALLIILERVGKAFRNPPRDAMLAHASVEMGRGWAFGLHEALDQIGALVGPLIAAAVLAVRGEYTIAFAVLLLPALLTLGTLAIARITYPQPQGLAAKPADVETAGLSRSLWIYMGGTMLVAAGFADFSLMAYHFDQAGIVAPALVPVFYAVAMGAGGLGSLLAGRQFDRTGLVLLIPLTIVTAAFAPLAFLGGATAGFIGVVLWGIGMGVHESILAAAVAELVPRVRIASAYGLFTTLYGVAWFIGSAVMGALYDRSPLALVTFSVVLELLAVPFFWAVRHAVRPSTVRGEGAA